MNRAVQREDLLAEQQQQKIIIIMIKKISWEMDFGLGMEMTPRKIFWCFYGSGDCDEHYYH
jgi:hypothetical protein